MKITIWQVLYDIHLGPEAPDRPDLKPQAVQVWPWTNEWSSDPDVLPPCATSTPGAVSYCNGLANTMAMAAAGSVIAEWALAYVDAEGVGGYYIPAQDELELIYRNYKPSAMANELGRHGLNVSSVPVGMPYSAEVPAQVADEVYQLGAPAALQAAWYMTSTQHSAKEYWAQRFDSGQQSLVPKNEKVRVRLVRRKAVAA